jgi:hypothetical protein
MAVGPASMPDPGYRSDVVDGGLANDALIGRSVLWCMY